MAQRRARTAALSAATAVAFAVTGCGSGHTATRAQVRTRANAICTHTLAQIRAVPPPAGDTSSLAIYLGKVQPIVDTEVRQVTALPRPSAGRPALERFITAVTAADRDYRRAAMDAAAGDTRAVAADLASLRSVDEASAARAYGLTDCLGTVATTG